MDKPTLSLRQRLIVCGTVVFDDPGPSIAASDQLVRAVELELAELGYVVSTSLRRRLAQFDADRLRAEMDRVKHALLESVGGNQNHKPLFRKFPQGVPDDTESLWHRKVLVHFLQQSGQPCLFCASVGTTHVLNPCRHVVCDRCFDGENYSACPVCERHVDRSSPFFLPEPTKAGANSSTVVRFKLLTLGESLEAEAKRRFALLCARKQALSPADREMLVTIVREFDGHILDWLPDEIPVRENVALILGTLARQRGANRAPELLPVASRLMNTATDILRWIAVISGCDGSLQSETKYVEIDLEYPTSRFWQYITRMVKGQAQTRAIRRVMKPIQVKRFKMAKLTRSFRRGLLELLERCDATSLTEDMLRHRSMWVWAGEFLHPGEYAKRFPKTAAAFAIIRRGAAEGNAPPFRTWNSNIERRILTRDSEALIESLRQRPGEFARKLDVTLRIAGPDTQAKVADAFIHAIPKITTPVLLTLWRHLPARANIAPIRMYWPKGKIALGANTRDKRPLLSTDVTNPLVASIEGELLSRFAGKPAYRTAIVDRALSRVSVPFNERTASQSSVSLPRGSRIPVPVEKTLRLFLHWCQPEKGGRTDLDLSIAFYNSEWKYVDVCSFYNLKAKNAAGQVIAKSSGDFQDAPWPDGASEFVDLYCEPALASGVRYAVMVVNNYAGLPFNLLERAFAGLMIRDQAEGPHFEPQAVALKFTVSGANGVFVPFFVDLRERMLHWVDIQARGELAMNNVASSERDLVRLCRSTSTYFGSGVRPSMYELALFHAAARCQLVHLRGEDGKARTLERGAGETTASFFRRLLVESEAAEGGGDSNSPNLADDEPVLAFLYHGNLALPEKSLQYVLFPEKARSNTAGADWVS